MNPPAFVNQPPISTCMLCILNSGHPEPAQIPKALTSWFPPGVPHLEQVYFCTCVYSVSSASISNIDETHFLARGLLLIKKQVINKYLLINKQKRNSPLPLSFFTQKFTAWHKQYLEPH